MRLQDSAAVAAIAFAGDLLERLFRFVAALEHQQNLGSLQPGGVAVFRPQFGVPALKFRLTMQSLFDDRVWLAWLVKVRIVILTFLLGIELAIARLTPSNLPVRLFVEVVFLWYTISVFYMLLLAYWNERRVQALLQVLTDMAMVTVVVYCTGGIDSSLNFLYPLVIIISCILLPRLWAYLAAALA